MKLSGKWALGLVAGGVLLGSVVSSAAQEGSLAPSGAPKRPKDARMHGGPGPQALKHAMRSESVFPGRDGGPVRTVRTDRGVLEAIDGKTLTIAEQDGTKVKVTAGDDTRVRRDGEQASLGDLKVGDHVLAMRHKEGDGEFALRGVQAMSAERFAEMRERREECRQNPESCRGRKAGHRPGGGPDARPGGDFGARRPAGLPRV